MVTYVYIVKCPNCEDEHFDFFNDAKEFAMGCLSQKPVITQTEVCRNDFGECTDHCDLGTVWSWEDMMTDTEKETADESALLTKDFLNSLDPENDPEFATIDNSVDFEIDEVSDDPRKSITEASDWNPKTPGYYGEEIFKMLDKLSNERVYDFLNEYDWSQFDRNADGIGDIYSNITAYLDKNSGYGLYSDLSKYFYHNGLDEACVRKPIPEGMTIEQLVEEMEENEDTVECTWCNDLFDKSECRKEVDLGWLCSRCEMAIKSRGETLTFREGSYWDFLDEDTKLKESAGKETVDLEYDDLTITIYGPKRDVDDWDEVEHSGSYTLTLDKDEVATTIWENFITEEDVTDVPGGLETLDGDDAWAKFLETHFDILFEKYYDALLKHYEDEATEAYEESYGWYEYQSDLEGDRADYEYESRRDDFYESTDKNSMIEELEDADAYTKRLQTCPECGTDSFDSETGICMNCGFNILR